MARPLGALLTAVTLTVVFGCGREPPADQGGARGVPPRSPASPGSPLGRTQPYQPGAAAGDYSHIDLFSPPHSTRLRSTYRRIEDMLASRPSNPTIRAQKVSVLYQAGVDFLDRGNRDMALEAFRAAFSEAQRLVADTPELPADMQESLSRVYYNGACARALEGDAALALEALTQAVEWGWSDLDMVQTDPDLASVRALPGFDEALVRWQQETREVAARWARDAIAAQQSFPFDFNVTDLTGRQLSLGDFRGKVVIVDFWGTWCPPCCEEIPSFVKLQEEYGPRGLQIIGLNYERQQGEAARTVVEEFIDANGINYPCAMGTPEIKAQVPDFRGYPTTLFLDRQGAVRLQLDEAHGYTRLESVVLALLGDAEA